MKITYLIPPRKDKSKNPERIFGCNYGYYPVPNVIILTLAAYLKENGHEFIYLDSPHEGFDEVKFLNYLKKDDSDIYFFFTVHLSKAIDKKCYINLRKIKPEVTVVFAGPVATENPAEFLLLEPKTDLKTIVLRGETEKIFLNITKYMNVDISNIKGISYLDIGKIINNEPEGIIEDLDILPFPDRNLVIDYYFNNPKLGKTPFTSILASRGCSFQCYYCVPNSLSFCREIEGKKYFHKKPKVVKRSADNIIKEIEMLQEQGYKAISFIDDQFFWEEERSLKICNALEKTDIIWGALSRVDLLTERVVKAAAESGCRYIDIGVESFNQEVLDYIRKGIRVETIYQAVKLLKKYKIDAKLNILIGTCPLETKEMIKGYIDEIKKLDVDLVMFGICNPFPGTEFNKIAREKGWTTTNKYMPMDVQKDAAISYPHLTNEDLVELVKWLNRKFYFSLRIIIRNIRKIRSFKGLIVAIRTFKRKMKYD